MTCCQRHDKYPVFDHELSFKHSPAPEFPRSRNPLQNLYPTDTLKCPTLHLAPDPASNEPVKTNRRSERGPALQMEKSIAIGFLCEKN
jgi:hypothetical protein